MSVMTRTSAIAHEGACRRGAGAAGQKPDAVQVRPRLLRKHGIILADCKFEFGLIDGEIVLIDEILRRIPPVSGMRRITR